MVRRVSFQAGSSTPLHLFGVELEKVGDDFGFGRVGRKAVGGQHGAVVHLVCGAEVGWHRGRVSFPLQDVLAQIQFDGD